MLRFLDGADSEAGPDQDGDSAGESKDNETGDTSVQIPADPLEEDIPTTKPAESIAQPEQGTEQMPGGRSSRTRMQKAGRNSLLQTCSRWWHGIVYRVCEAGYAPARQGSAAAFRSGAVRLRADNRPGIVQPVTPRPGPPRTGEMHRPRLQGRPSR